MVEEDRAVKMVEYVAELVVWLGFGLRAKVVCVSVDIVSNCAPSNWERK